MADNGLEDELIVRVENVFVFLSFRVIGKHEMWQPQTIGDIDKCVVTLRLTRLGHCVAFETDTHDGSLFEI